MKNLIGRDNGKVEEKNMLKLNTKYKYRMCELHAHLKDGITCGRLTRKRLIYECFWLASSSIVNIRRVYILQSTDASSILAKVVYWCNFIVVCADLQWAAARWNSFVSIYCFDKASTSSQKNKQMNRRPWQSEMFESVRATTHIFPLSKFHLPL